MIWDTVSLQVRRHWSNVTHWIDKLNANTADDTCADRHIIVCRTSLQPATEQGEETFNDNSLSSSELVPESPTNETAKHSTEIVDRDQASLLGGVGNPFTQPINPRL